MTKYISPFSCLKQKAKNNELASMKEYFKRWSEFSAYFPCCIKHNTVPLYNRGNQGQKRKKKATVQSQPLIGGFTVNGDRMYWLAPRI